MSERKARGLAERMRYRVRLDACPASSVCGVISWGGSLDEMAGPPFFDALDAWAWVNEALMRIDLVATKRAKDLERELAAERAAHAETRAKLERVRAVNNGSKLTGNHDYSSGMVDWSRRIKEALGDD